MSGLHLFKVKISKRVESTCVRGSINSPTGSSFFPPPLAPRHCTPPFASEASQHCRKMTHPIKSATTDHRNQYQYSYVLVIAYTGKYHFVRSQVGHIGSASSSKRTTAPNNRRKTKSVLSLNTRGDDRLVHSLNVILFLLDVILTAESRPAGLKAR